MMTEVLLEEEQTPDPESPLRDELVTEQAQKLFGICDDNGKGFIAKADLIKIDGFISEMPLEKLELFFDSIDTSKTNIVTESQFIENIKPILSRMEISQLTPKAVVEIQANKDLTEEIQKKAVAEEAADGTAEQSLEEIRQQSQATSSQAFSQKADSVIGLEVDKVSVADPKLHFEATLHDQFSTDQLSPAERSAQKSQVSGDNKVSQVTPDSSNDMELTLKSQLWDRGGRETSSQVDLRRSLYRPDVLPSPGSKSLADQILQSSLFSASHILSNTAELAVDVAVVREELKDVGEGNKSIPVEPHAETPLDRIFKVVFVGDSAVGKTCFLHRFCHNRFKPLFNATIGVDFTVKTIKVRDKIVAVQLWDTAGQERFRSITKQYFRKADGVIIMYDVTSEQSYLNVRNWITSVQAGVDENCILCLVGNKVDLYGNQSSRVLTYQHGQQLADEYGMMFFETSAYTGYNIKECMKDVAEKLQQKEDDNLVEALKLESADGQSKRSWCCL